MRENILRIKENMKKVIIGKDEVMDRIWQRGGYSYSLSLEKGADAATFLKIAEENQ